MNETSGASVRISLPRHPEPAQLRITGARLNEVSLDTSRLELVVRPEIAVTGSVTLRYSAPTPTATWWLGATPTWGAPATSYASCGALSAPAVDRVRREHVTFIAPTDPGTNYYLFIFAIGMESSADFLLSGTNWVIGHAGWKNRDVVARWPAKTIELAMRIGTVDAMVSKRHEGQLGHFAASIGAAAVRVVVLDAAD